MDRYTLMWHSELDDILAPLPEHDQALHRSRLAEQAWTAWQAAKEAGDDRGLAHHQQVVIEAEVTRNRAAAGRNAAGRARIEARTLAANTYPEPGWEVATGYADLAEDLPFAAARARQEAAQAEHAGRRRRVEQQVASDERLHARLRDAYGPDQADRLMGDVA